jgi:hypothetical protein
MHPQLDAIASEFGHGSQRLHRLADSVSEEGWAERPRPEAWSVGECVAHLNLTTQAFRPLVAKALDEARRLPRPSGSPRFRPGIMGSLLLWALSKPGRFRTKTTAPFVPGGAGSRGETIQEFSRLQEEQIGWVRAADGLALMSVRVISPFDRRLRYNLFACLSVLARHQQRHLWQAEQAWKAVQERRGGRPEGRRER